MTGDQETDKTKKSTNTNNVNIMFIGTATPVSKRCANEFSNRFTPHPPSEDNILRSIHKQRNSDVDLFTVEMVSNALKDFCTDDKIVPIRLKHNVVGAAKTSYITQLY